MSAMAIFNIYQLIIYTMSISDKEKKLLKRTRKINRNSTIPNTAAVISSRLDMRKSEVEKTLDDLHERGYIGTKHDAPSAREYIVTIEGKKKLP